MIRRLWLLTCAMVMALLAGCLHSQWSDRPGPGSAPKKEGIVTAQAAGDGTINQQTQGFEAPPREPDVRPAPIEPARVEITPAELPSRPAQPPPRPRVFPLSLEKIPPPDPPAVAALRCLLKKHVAEASVLLQGYDRGRQELLRGLLPLAARVAAADYEHASPQEKAALLEQMMALVQLLRSQAPLVLDHLCLCEEIQGFGAYRPLPPDHVFQPCLHPRFGEHMRVYVEVRNFNSQPCAGGWYQTRLKPTVEILDFHKRVVHRIEPRSRSELTLTRTPRQDYYINIQFNLPPNMPQGPYTLRVQVRDEAQRFNDPSTPRIAVGSLDFQVGKGCPIGPRANRTLPPR
jgi:hypothetical protein